MAIAFFYLLSTVTLNGQTVWPGDINNNGTVSSVDLLYWGLAFGEKGPDRDNASTTWVGQPLSNLWSNNYLNGTNYAFADCDGDGVVDDNDITSGIVANFGQNHGTFAGEGYANGSDDFEPILQLSPVTTTAAPGSQVIVNLSLGNTAVPVSDFYGIAFGSTFDAALHNLAELGTFWLQHNLILAQTLSGRRQDDHRGPGHDDGHRHRLPAFQSHGAQTPSDRAP